MVECWHDNPERRPRFAEIYHRLQGWQVLSPAQSSALNNHRVGAGGSSHSGRYDTFLFDNLFSTMNYAYYITAHI